MTKPLLTVLPLLLCALALGEGVRATFSSFTAEPITASGSTFGAATLGSFISVTPGTDTQPGTSTKVAAGNADLLSVNLGTVPSARTFSAVVTVTNMTSQPLPLVLSSTLPSQVSSVVFTSTGTVAATLAAGASTSVAIRTSSTSAGTGTGTIRLGRSDLAWLYRDYPLTLTEAPEAPAAVTAVAGPAGVISVAWTATSTVADLAGYYVYRSTGAGAFTKLTPSPINGTTFSDALTVDGTSYSYLVDSIATAPAGLSSVDSLVATATADATPPVVSVTKINGASVVFPLATNATVTTIGGACESATGNAPASWKVTGDATASGTATCSAGAWAQTLTVPLSAEGHYSISATQTDAAGNQGSSPTKAITVDNTKPVITATALANGSPYSAGTWTNQSVTVSFTCADTGAVQSGLATNSVGGGGTQSAETTAGSFTNTGSCTDVAGNTAVANTFSPIKIDKTKPVITTTAKNADLTAYVAGTWTKQAVTVSFTCADTGSVQSGLLTNTTGGGGTQSADTSNGSFTSSGSCLDNAGNSADAVTFSPIKVDATPPAGGTVDGVGLVGTGSRYSTSLSMSIAFTKGTDTGSGLAPTGATLWGAQGTLSSTDGVIDGTCTAFGAYAQASGSDPTSPFTSPLPTDNACYRAQYRVLDNLGNLATYTSGDIKVETTAPASLTPVFTFTNVVGSIDPVGNTVYFRDLSNGSGSVTLTASSTDARSGISGYTFPTPPTGWTVGGSGTSRTYSYTGTAGTAGSIAITAANNASKTAATTLTFTADDTIPNLALTSPSDGSSTNDTTPTLSGTCLNSGTDPVTVSVRQGASVIQTLTDANCISTGFSVTASPALAQGTYTAVATQTINGGRPGSSTTITFTVDTTAPVVTLTKVNGSITTFPLLSSVASITTIGGACGTATGDAATVTWAVTGGSTESASTACSAGSWSATLTTALTAEAVYTLAATQTDAATNSGSSGNQSVTLDRTAPTVTLTAPVNGGYVTTTTPALSGAAGNATGDATTVTVKIYSGPTTGGTLVQTLTPTRTAATWTATAAALGQGQYTAQATQVDATGNVGTTAANTFTIDSIAPTVTINQAAGQSDPSNASMINFTATFSEAVTGFANTDVTKSSGAIVVSGGPAIFNVAVTGMTNGSALTVSIAASVAADLAGNQNTASTSTDNQVTYDATAPVVSLTKVNGSVVAFPLVTNLVVTSIGGACGAVTRDIASVSWSVAGTANQSGSAACSAGAWSATVTALADDVYTLSATQSDTAGNVGASGNQSLTVDRTPPAVSLTVPANGSYATTTTPTVSGIAGNVTGDSTTVTVKIYSGPTTGGTLVQTLTPTRAGAVWTTTPAALAQGTFTAQATQTDTAGNTGTTSANSFTVDSIAPVVSLTKLNGSIVVFPLTSNAASVTTAGGVCGATAGDNATVSWSVGGGSTQSGAATCSAGAWTATLTTPLTAEVAYTLSATQSDAAGNTGNSGSQSLTLDRTAPAVTLTAPVNGSSIATTTPALSGAAGNATGDSATVTVKIYSGPTTGGTLLQTLTPTRVGAAWSSVPAALAQGTFTAQATQTDTAGNNGTTSANTFTVDTTPPVVALTKLNGSTVTFPLISNSASIATAGGACGAVSGDTATVSWSVSGGSTQSGTTACTAGAWAATLTTPLTAETTYALAASQSDAAGNIGSSGSQALTLDRTAPAVTLTAPANGGSVSSTTPGLSGAAGNAAGDSTTVTVKVYSGPTTGGTLLQTLTPTRAGAAWSTTPAALAQGTYTVQATQTDTAANTGTTSANTFTVDTTAPVVTLTKINGSAVTFPLNSNAASISTVGGTCGTLSGDAATVSWSVSGGSTQSGTAACAAGLWTGTLTTPLTSETSYTLAATQGDAAGNTGSSGNQTLLLDRTAPTLVSVVAANGNGSAGFIGAGSGTPDTLTFTYSDANGVSPGSIVAGWDGTGTKTVSVTFTNAATDSIAVLPGIGTVTLGASNWLSATTTVSETLSMTSTNVFVISITTTPNAGGPSNVAASNFTWSATGGTAADATGNVATGSVTTNTQRF